MSTGFFLVEEEAVPVAMLRRGARGLTTDSARGLTTDSGQSEPTPSEPTGCKSFASFTGHGSGLGGIDLDALPDMNIDLSVSSSAWSFHTAPGRTLAPPPAPGFRRPTIEANVCSTLSNRAFMFSFERSTFSSTPLILAVKFVSMIFSISTVWCVCVFVCV